MPGLRPRNPHIGDRAEYLGTFLLSWVAQALPVPRQEDYGLDFHGALLWPSGQSFRIGRGFSVQFKSNQNDLFGPYGKPTNATGVWRQDEVRWLLGLEPFPVDPTPLFLCHVDVPSATATLYSTAPMWNARWLGVPTEVAFESNTWPPLFDLDGSRDPFQRVNIKDCYPRGFPQPVPGMAERVTVPIGRPVARITAADAEAPDADARRQAVVRTLDEWIRVDTLNRLAAMLEVPVCFWHGGWVENEPPNPAHQESNSYANGDPNAGLPAAQIERNLRQFVVAWDRVRTAQGEQPLLTPRFHQNAILDRLAQPGGIVGRTVEINNLRRRADAREQ